MTDLLHLLTVNDLAWLRSMHVTPGDPDPELASREDVERIVIRERKRQLREAWRRLRESHKL